MFYLIKYYFYKVRNWFIPSYKLRIEYSNSTYKSDRIYLIYDDVLLNDS